jgi:hypothetical protein
MLITSCRGTKSVLRRNIGLHATGGWAGAGPARQQMHAPADARAGRVMR